MPNRQYGGAFMAQSLRRKILLYGFVAGMLGMAASHQGTIHVMHFNAAKIPSVAAFFGPFPRAYILSATGPFGMPWLAFLLIQGGLWGIVIAALLRATSLPDLLFGFLFGAVVIAAFDLLAMPALMGRGPNLHPGAQLLARTILVDGALGFGTVFFLRPFQVRG